jgi:kynurenine formamidase
MSETPDFKAYQELAFISLFGKNVRVLDLTHEINENIPIYPGHAKTATWWHLTHEECVMRLGDTPFEGYGVKGIVTCEHTSTHVDAVYHFNKHRPDLTVDKIPLEYMITPGAWIDVSYVPPRTHISLQNIKDSIKQAGVQIKAGSTLLYYTGVEKYWNNHQVFLTQYPGLDSEATEWILDQGVVNVCTDAPSTDNPADITYPNHTIHAKRLVIHTELVANISKIPRKDDFYYAMFPWRLTGGTGCPIRALALWEE